MEEVISISSEIDQWGKYHPTKKFSLLGILSDGEEN
jgi:hypothetical protein